MRLRSTAPPTCLLTVKPNRASSSEQPRRFASSTNAGVAQRAPPRTRRKSDRRLRVSSRPPGLTFPWVLAMCHPPRRASGGQALAALGAPTRQDPTASGGLHALAEPVAALANELARLIGALHISSPCPP